MTINELFEDFIKDMERIGRKKSTILSHKTQIQKHIEPTLGHIKLSDLKKSDVGYLIEHARNHSGKSIENHAVITLRRLLCFAVGQGHQLKFDWRDIEVPPYRVKSDVQALTHEEINQVREALRCDHETYSKFTGERMREKHLLSIERTRCLFEFLLHTGLRISEALSVNIEDLNFETCELRIENIKTGTWDSVYLYGCEQAISGYLMRRTDEHPALFVSTDGGRLAIGSAKSTLRRLQKRIGLKHNLTHKVLRSTFVTILFRARRDPKEVQYLARHASLQTTIGYYYKVAKESLKPIHKEVMEKV